MKKEDGCWGSDGFGSFCVRNLRLSNCRREWSHDWVPLSTADGRGTTSRRPSVDHPEDHPFPADKVWRYAGFFSESCCPVLAKSAKTPRQESHVWVVSSPVSGVAGHPDFLQVRHPLCDSWHSALVFWQRFQPERPEVTNSEGVTWCCFADSCLTSTNLFCKV